MPVTMINPFKVPSEQEEEFLKHGNETTAVYSRTAGLIETHRHRNTGAGHLTLNYIKIAIWALNEAFIQAYQDYAPGEESIPGIQFHPAI